MRERHDKKIVVIEMTSVDSMNCTTCGEANRVQAKYCHYCGQPLPQTASTPAPEPPEITPELSTESTSTDAESRASEYAENYDDSLGETAHTMVRPAWPSNPTTGLSTTDYEGVGLSPAVSALPTPPYQPAGFYPPAPNPPSARLVAAWIVLWAGLILSDAAVTYVPWLHNWILPAQFSQRGLGLTDGAGPRLVAYLIWLAGPMIAALLVPTTPARRVSAVACWFAAAATSYAFTFDTARSAWIAMTLMLTLGLTGWLVLRARQAWAYVLLVPCFVWGVARWAPYPPSRWFAEQPYLHHWPLFLSVFWSVDAAFVPLILLTLFAALKQPGAAAQAHPSFYVSAALLQVAAVVVIVILSVTTYLPAQYRVASTQASDDLRLTPTASTTTSADQPTITQAQASNTAGALLSAMQTGSTFYSCDGSVGRVGLATYSIDEVSPDTNGYFQVRATVTLSNSSEQVDYVLAVRDQPACVQSMTPVGSSAPAATPIPTVSALPTGVPAIPSSGDPIPTGDSAPSSTLAGSVISYQDVNQTPSSAAQLVDYQPTGLTGDEQSAISDIIGFWTNVNLQQFQAAWNLSTDATVGATATASFQRGFATTRIYQLAFGAPKDLTGNLIAIPARFVSRQNPAAQGSPSGVTPCSYWPQYVFLVARVNGQWLTDVAGKYTSDPSVTPLKRYGSSGWSLNPVSQRTAC